MNIQGPLVHTLVIGIATAALSGLLGIVLAWLTTRTALPGKERLARLFALPYAVPPYLLGIAWVILGNPQVGLLKDWVPGSHGIYGLHGIIWVLTTVCFAFPYLELRAGFDRLDPALEEAARMSGANTFKVFKDVSFPLLWPSLLSGMLTAFLYAISAFGVPALLGAPTRQFVLTTLIYSKMRMGGIDALPEAIRISLWLLSISVLAIGGVALSTRLQKRRLRLVPIGGARFSRPSLVQLGIWAKPLALVSSAFLILTVLLPWMALTLSALAPVAGQFSPSQWTLRNILYVVGLPDFHQAILNSMMLALSVSLLLVGSAFLLAFAAVRRGSEIAAWTIQALGVPFSTPGTLIAVFMIVFSSAVARITGLPVDLPLILMFLAYGIKYAAISARSLTHAFQQVHPALEEAARISGARTFVLLRTIWLPLLRQSLAAAFFLTFLPILSELTMSVLLTGPGGATLGTVLFQLQEYADQPSASALAWMMLTVALVIALKDTRRESSHDVRT